MKEMIKIELERSLRSVAFRVSLIIGMLIVTIQFISVGLHNALNPLEFFQLWWIATAIQCVLYMDRWQL